MKSINMPSEMLLQVKFFPTLVTREYLEAVTGIDMGCNILFARVFYAANSAPSRKGAGVLLGRHVGGVRVTDIRLDRGGGRRFVGFVWAGRRRH